MEVEPDLADCGNLAPPRQHLERRAIPDRLEVLRLVRMDADRREDAVVPVCQFDRRRGVLQSRPRYEKPADSRRSGALEDGRHIPLPHLEMAVAIRQDFGFWILDFG